MSKRTAPSGTNITPITKKVGITLFAVITGCHAGSLCCLNAVSIKVTNKWVCAITKCYTKLNIHICICICRRQKQYEHAEKSLPSPQKLSFIIYGWQVENMEYENLQSDIVRLHEYVLAGFFDFCWESTVTGWEDVCASAMSSSWLSPTTTSHKIYWTIFLSNQ